MRRRAFLGALGAALVGSRLSDLLPCEPPMVPPACGRGGTPAPVPPGSLWIESQAGNVWITDGSNWSAVAFYTSDDQPDLADKT